MLKNSTNRGHKVTHCPCFDLWVCGALWRKKAESTALWPPICSGELVNVSPACCDVTGTSGKRHRGFRDHPAAEQFLSFYDKTEAKSRVEL